MRPGHLLPPVLLLALVGCSSPRVEVREVRIPIPVPCPQPILPPRPVLASRLLSKESPADQVWKAVLSDLAALMGYAEGLETLWQAHEKPKEKQKEEQP